MNPYSKDPTDKQFEEIKEKAMLIWSSYDNTYGYVDEKVETIQNIKNNPDSLILIVNMFDGPNQQKLAQMLKLSTSRIVGERLRAGGTPDSYNPFI